MAHQPNVDFSRPLTTSIADTERVLGRKLTFFERAGLWFDSITTRRKIGGNVAPAVRDFQGGFLTGAFPLTGDIADALSRTAPGELGATIGKGAIDTIEVVGEAAARAAAISGGLAKAVGPFGLLAIVGGGVWFFFLRR